MYKTKNGGTIGFIEVNVYSADNKLIFSDILSSEATEEFLNVGVGVAMLKELDDIQSVKYSRE